MTKPTLGLRFDKVATRLTDRLALWCRQIVPGGMAVRLTITAPIRLASKTASAIEDKIQRLVRRRSPGRDVRAIINGNRVRIRLVKPTSRSDKKFVGYVHNPDIDPLELLARKPGS